MSEYGSGLTLGQCCNYDKERIKHAFKGELMIGEDENGFVYEPAYREECEAYILSAYDDLYYQAKQLADSVRAMDRLAEKYMEGGFQSHFREYMNIMAEEYSRFDDYVYEDEYEPYD